MSNVKYRFSEDGLVAYGELASGQIFVIDADMVEKIRTVKFYLGSKGNGSQYYVIDCKGRTLHDYLFEHRPGYEIDHINLDTFDNRRCNIGYCTCDCQMCPDLTIAGAISVIVHISRTR